MGNIAASLRPRGAIGGSAIRAVIAVANNLKVRYKRDVGLEAAII